MFCKDCNTTGSNLIGRITVGSDTITAYEAGLDPAVFHYNAGHVITNQCYIDSCLI